MIDPDAISTTELRLGLLQSLKALKLLRAHVDLQKF